MRDLIIREMENYFGSDQKRINHAKKVLRYSEELLDREGGYPEVVIAAAILHDIGIHAAGKKYGSNAGKYQEIEGPPIADKILKKINFPAEKIAEVLDIIAHHHSPGIVKTRNFRILYDADCRVNREER
jgi:HD superfamily phosphodiesterase